MQMQAATCNRANKLINIVQCVNLFGNLIESVGTCNEKRQF